MNTAAIYARVSTADQIKGTSLDGQIEACRQFAKANNYTVIKEVAEDISGAMLARPGLDSIRDMAARGELAAVIVFDPDRLSRVLGHLMLLTEEFDTRRASVAFVNAPREDTPEGRMLFGMKGLFAEYERTKIMERTRRGKERRVKEGRVVLSWAVPYGYKFIKGQGRLEPIASEAIWAVKIFEWCALEGCSLGEITRRLEGAGVITKRGANTWQRSTIQRILSNHVYMGIWYYNKRESVVPRKPRKEANRQKKGSRGWKPKTEWIGVAVPALISPGLFEAAGKQLKRNLELSPRNHKYFYLLSGLVTCAACGYKMSGTTKVQLYGIHRTYRCSARYYHQRHLPPKQRCHASSLDSNMLEALIWSEVARQLSDPSLIIETLHGRSSSMEREQQRSKEELEALDAAGRVMKREVDKLLDLHMSDVIDLATLQERMVEVKKKQAALAETRANLTKRIEQHELITGNIEAVQQLCARVQKGVPYFTEEDKREFMEALDLQISIRGRTVNISGLITDATLTLAAKMEEPEDNDDDTDSSDYEAAAVELRPPHPHFRDVPPRSRSAASSASQHEEPGGKDS